MFKYCMATKHTQQHKDMCKWEGEAGGGEMRINRVMKRGSFMKLNKKLSSTPISLNS